MHVRKLQLTECMFWLDDKRERELELNESNKGSIEREASIQANLARVCSNCSIGLCSL